MACPGKEMRKWEVNFESAIRSPSLVYTALAIKTVILEVYYESKITSLPEYITWLFKQYQELKQIAQPNATYKLVNIEENKNDKTILTIQVTAKALTFKSTPQEILADDKTTECFSSKDIRTITYYACQTLNKPKNKIVIQKQREFSGAALSKQRFFST